ncbi:beta-lactamase family protein [Spirosoma sp. BT702]|uniref:Beta-lactamase family protein n=1 Tax=Spirosoma profusum TaxID=2771354 RepID=A0A927GBB6_9BACT|nr:serine hydrolase domain-containing protein [Spirosoma profusum]MBD2705865.1 beta-lactamase family protein [Spirosoma profusum]
MPFLPIKAALLSCLLTIQCAFGQSNFGANKAETNLDSLLQQHATAFIQKAPFAALSVGVINKGKTYFYNYGTIRSGQNQLPSSSTIYEIGSITKTFTGTLLAQAVVSGELKLEDDIRQYMDDHYPNLEYQGQPIRLVHLLNHSSGLPFSLPRKSVLFTTLTDSIAFEKQRRAYTPKDFFRDLHQVKLDTVPGIKLRYSNAADQLLGYILERVYQLSYEQLIQRYISHPLGMKHTYTQRSKSQQVQSYNGAGKVMPYFLQQELAAGGIYSATADLLRYAQWHLDESNPIVKLSHEPTWGTIQYYAIGLNWQMDEKAPLPRRIFQSGGTAGFSSYLILHPDQQRGIVLLTNISEGNTQ